MKKYALFSLYEVKPLKVSKFADILVNKGWTILVTGETASILAQKNIPFVDIDEFIVSNVDFGFPPTMHPRVEYALTSDKCLAKIEIVFDITYPAKIGNDIGGHTLLAFAVKGDRIPVTSYEDMEEVVRQLKSKNAIPQNFKRSLQEKALIKIMKHYGGQLSSLNKDISFVGFQRTEMLKNGENPYQIPAYLCSDLNGDNHSNSIIGFKKISGETPCYTNLADIDNLLHTLSIAAKAFYRYYNKIPYISIAGKHGNPCGLSIDWLSPEKTIEMALWGNPMAIWGGEFISNFILTESCARLLYSSRKRKKYIGSSQWMLDVILAPEIEEKSKRLLGARKQTKLYINKQFRPESSQDTNILKSVRGGFLTQPPYNYVLDFAKLSWTTRLADEHNIDSYIVAWAVAYSSFQGGNEVAIAKRGGLIGAGGGPSTVEATKIAVWRANENKHSIEKSVFATDAFLPFSDTLEVLRNAGCIGGVVPKGGVNHHKIVKFCRDNNIKVGFIPEEYRGFCRH